jgi:hypothetical protein
MRTISWLTIYLLSGEPMLCQHADGAPARQTARSQPEPYIFMIHHLGLCLFAYCHKLLGIGAALRSNVCS